MTAQDREEIAALDAIEAAAYADLFAAAPAPFAAALGMRVETVAGATLLIAPGLPNTQFNRVIGLGVARPATVGDLDEVAARYRTAGVAEFWIHCGPASAPSELEKWMVERGFAIAPRRSWAKVVRGTEPPPVFPTTVEVREIGRDEAHAWAEVIVAAFGLPPPVAAWTGSLIGRERWRGYLAIDAGVPIGGAAMYCRDGRAWLGLAGTLPTARRRGGQGALMGCRIHDAIALGCTMIATETGEPTASEPNPSLANMYRYGFRRACSRENWASPRPTG